ncbi:hypothetical protein [Erwinia rhapontici]|uniref:hypothetical protein n=1 Tax=Erwinia rhapontici TaxID=55212 RepID=UPI00216A230E|nr:hypothetical protein [Erwinia rhapontici]MCS3605303.1 hypothetical protein [Erwinia rhapontici]
MSRFIVVIHGWHVHSNGFSVHQIDAIDNQEAAEKAAFLTMQRQKAFDKCAYVVVEIGQEEIINRARKLTWRERLTGRAK